MGLVCNPCNSLDRVCSHGGRGRCVRGKWGWFAFHPVAPYEHTMLGMQGHIENLVPCTRRSTSSLFQTFLPPSSKDCSSGGHFLFLLLLVLSRSYSLYSGEHFLLWVLYFSLSLWFKYSLYSHTFIVRIYNHVVLFLFILGERTGSLLGIISLSISVFYILLILPPFIFVISMFDIIAHRLFIGSVQCLCASWLCILCLYSVFFHLLFLFIPHAYFLRIFSLYLCMHPYVLHHPTPSVWRDLYLEGHIYLEEHIYLEGSIWFEDS